MPDRFNSEKWRIIWSSFYSIKRMNWMAIPIIMRNPISKLERRSLISNDFWAFWVKSLLSVICISERSNKLACIVSRVLEILSFKSSKSIFCVSNRINSSKLSTNCFKCSASVWVNFVVWKSAKSPLIFSFSLGYCPLIILSVRASLFQIKHLI